ncbi:hypothetical protein BCR32DRAFT_281361 [Anaeromyces robustus]|uniref:Uncharacterized protein n=1 Tax=Anaeromyces robustus TaxID=1754192 RepID=A0A1Y1X1H7_9FUNG|nr:hypothetical protein BCR32DRAFT_281361 [Anaeromyces robustus]|eukprot:ORX79515.1 hypothetical protein BCR32DRAFT_281361 [Anaeromyces robustus]
MFQTSSKCTPDGDNLYLVKNASFFKPIDFRFMAFIETLNGENLGRIGPTTR